MAGRPYAALDELQQAAIDDLFEARKLPKVAHSRRAVGCVRFLLAVKRPEMVSYASNLYAGVPTRTGSCWVRALQTLAALFGVPAILAGRSISKIRKPVVRLDPVPMIYIFRRPLAGFVRPRKAVRQVRPLIYTDRPVPIFRRRTGYFSDARPNSIHFPGEYSSFRVVVKQRSKFSDRYFSGVFSHGRVLSCVR